MNTDGASNSSPEQPNCREARYLSRPAPGRAGAGLKPEHVSQILAEKPDIGFFEVHAENYMGAGGLPHRQLSDIREHYSISLHGVGLSIGAMGPLDRAHLLRLKALVDRYDPALFSEHLAWSTHNDIYYNDLLPVPYNEPVLQRVCDHIDEVQETIGRRMLLENPSTYVSFSDSTMKEVEFLKDVVLRTGCGLLLDVNNVYVSSVNHATEPCDYLKDFPLSDVGEIHLAGHAPDQDDEGKPLLIDSHDRKVADIVWSLYETVLAETGPLPTLIEWDSDIPAWPVLLEEAGKADCILAQIAGARPYAAA